MKEEQFDRLFRESISQLDGAPPQASHWDMEGTFQKIQEEMHQTGGRRFPRIFDLAAAAVTLLLTASYFMGQYIYEHADEPTFAAIVNLWEGHAHELPTLNSKPVDAPKTPAKTTLVAGKHVNSVPTSLASYQPSSSQRDAAWLTQKPLAYRGMSISLSKGNMADFMLMNSVPNKQLSASRREALLQKTRMAQMIEQPSEVENSKLVKMASVQKPFNFSVPVGVGVVSDRFSPVIGVKATWNKPSKASANQFLTLATSVNAYPSFNVSESGNVEVQNALFVEGSIGKRNTNGKIFTGHEIGAGLLLQSDDTRFEKGTIKLNYSIKIKEKISVTPEVILTDNFSKPLPGIKLTLG